MNKGRLRCNKCLFLNNMWTTPPQQPRHKISFEWVYTNQDTYNLTNNNKPDKVLGKNSGYWARVKFHNWRISMTNWCKGKDIPNFKCTSYKVKHLRRGLLAYSLGWWRIKMNPYGMLYIYIYISKHGKSHLGYRTRNIRCLGCHLILRVSFLQYKNKGLNLNMLVRHPWHTWGEGGKNLSRV